MKKIIILISIIFFLFVGISVYSQEPAPTPRGNSQNWQNCSTKTDKNGDTHQYCTQKEPLLIKAVESKTTNPTTDKQGQNIDHNPVSKNSINIIFSKDFINISSLVLSAIATIAIAIFTFFLVRYNKKTWEITAQNVKATEKAADAAKISADAAQKSVESLPTIERAYLYVSSININMQNWMYAPSDQLTPIKIEVSNYGRTPAKVKEIITEIQIGESNKEGIISYGTPDIDEIIDAAGRFIARDSTEEFDRPIHIMSLIDGIGLHDGWHGIGTRNYHISFSGEVRYRDIFEKDHIAYFNWYFVSRFNRGFYINNPELNYTT